MGRNPCFGKLTGCSLKRIPKDILKIFGHAVERIVGGHPEEIFRCTQGNVFEGTRDGISVDVLGNIYRHIQKGIPSDILRNRLENYQALQNVLQSPYKSFEQCYISVIPLKIPNQTSMKSLVNP